MATYNSTLYASRDVNHYVEDNRDDRDQPVQIPFAHTITANDASGGLVRLCTIPANCEVRDLSCITDGLAASGGVGLTLQIGDSGDDDRYMKATDFDVTGARGKLAYAGMRYRPSVDTIVLAKFAVANPVAAQHFSGSITVVPGK